MTILSLRFLPVICFISLAAHADAAGSRLLASGRRSGNPLAGDFDLPVFHLLHDGKAHSHVGAWALKGTPTHYTPNGCKKVNKVYSQVVSDYSASMSTTRCFAFCSKRKGLSYFGVTDGNKCWCGQAIDASPLGSGSCDKPCPGDPKDMCGGIEGTNVYTMYDCTADTKEEIAQEKAEKKEALLTSYGSLNHETCGQAKDNILQIDDKGFLTGSVDTCKLACWQGKGAQECHGFTYDSVTSKCTFHYDVTAGPVTKSGTSACYFKIA